MASISKEEKVVRETICYQKILLRNEKYVLNVFKNIPETPFFKDRLQEVCASKCIIKALKKQLPAPRKHYTDEVCDYIGCPICYFETYKDYPCYCLECGQKLR